MAIMRYTGKLAEVSTKPGAGLEYKIAVLLNSPTLWFNFTAEY
jgi:hypothetical protein